MCRAAVSRTDHAGIARRPGGDDVTGDAVHLRSRVLDSRHFWCVREDCALGRETSIVRRVTHSTRDACTAHKGVDSYT